MGADDAIRLGKETPLHFTTPAPLLLDGYGVSPNNFDVESSMSLTEVRTCAF